MHTNWRTPAIILGMWWVLAVTQAVAAGVSPQDLFQAAAQIKVAAKDVRELAHRLEGIRPNPTIIDAALAKVRTLSTKIQNAKAVIIRRMQELSGKTHVWLPNEFKQIDQILDQLPFLLTTDRNLSATCDALHTLNSHLKWLHGEALYFARSAPRQ
jgi:type II secretory pathway component PulM